jgi:hypothetical protein
MTHLRGAADQHASTAPFPMNRTLKFIRGILPCRFSVSSSATPPSRPAKRVGIYTSQLRMVPSQAGRRNAKYSLAHPRECPECANSVQVSRKGEIIREFIRRPKEPHSSVPPGDAAIAACQARVRDDLGFTQLRDISFS